MVQSEEEQTHPTLSKLLNVYITNVYGIENVTSDKDDGAYVTINLDNVKHIIELEQDESTGKFRLPEPRTCFKQFDVSKLNISSSDLELVFHLVRRNPKTPVQRFYNNMNYYLYGLPDYIARGALTLGSETEIDTATVPINHLMHRGTKHMALHFKDVTLSITLEWPESVASTENFDKEPVADPILLEKYDLLEDEMMDLRPPLWPTRTSVLEEDSEVGIRKILDDRCVVLHLLTKFTQIDEAPLDRLRSAMIQKGLYITEYFIDQSANKKPEAEAAVQHNMSEATVQHNKPEASVQPDKPEEADILKNLGEATRWKLDFTIMMAEELGCNFHWFDLIEPKKLKNIEITTLKAAVNNHYQEDVTKKRVKQRTDVKKTSAHLPFKKAFNTFLGRKSKVVSVKSKVSKTEAPIPPNIPYLYSGRQSIIAALKQVNWGHFEGPFLYNKPMNTI